MYCPYYRQRAAKINGHKQPDGSDVEDCAIVILDGLRFSPNWHDIPCASASSKQYICTNKSSTDSAIHAIKPESIEFTNNDCGQYMYKCNSTECISVTKICDGTPDCMDGSDEDSITCGLFEN